MFILIRVAMIMIMSMIMIMIMIVMVIINNEFVFIIKFKVNPIIIFIDFILNLIKLIFKNLFIVSYSLISPFIIFIILYFLNFIIFNT